MNSSYFSAAKNEFSENLYLYIPLTIILQSCVGSIAAMLILMQGTSLLTFVQLLVCTVLCMGYNGALLAQLKPTISFWLLLVSLSVNTALIFLNLL
ncbi:hypothetical protein [Rasiella sp. SM2506]|uniref:hypothetical protein n=1 Tax=Rasiella sp. SM2506 TaxID=3423914 RepID=UPI003D7A9A18